MLFMKKGRNDNTNIKIIIINKNTYFYGGLTTTSVGDPFLRLFPYVFSSCSGV